MARGCAYSPVKGKTRFYAARTDQQRPDERTDMRDAVSAEFQFVSVAMSRSRADSNPMHFHDEQLPAVESWIGVAAGEFDQVIHE